MELFCPQEHAQIKSQLLEKVKMTDWVSARDVALGQLLGHLGFGSRFDFLPPFLELAHVFAMVLHVRD